MIQNYPFIKFNFADEKLQKSVNLVLAQKIPIFMGFYAQENKNITLDYITALSLTKQRGKFFEDVAKYGEMMDHHTSNFDIEAINEVSKMLVNKYSNFQHTILGMRKIVEMLEEVIFNSKNAKRNDHWNIVKYWVRNRGFSL